MWDPPGPGIELVPCISRQTPNHWIIREALLLLNKSCVMRCAQLLQSCLILCDSTDYSPPGSSVCGTFQARMLEWVAMSFSRDSSRPRDRTHVSCSPALQVESLPTEPLFYRAWQKYLVFIIGTLGIYCWCGIFPLGIKGEFR